MSNSKCDVKTVLHEMEVLVKNIIDKRNMLILQFRGDGSLSYDQTRRLINIYTDEILDGSGPVDFINLVTSCVIGHVPQQSRNTRQEEGLRLRINQLELTLEEQKKILERTQNQNGKMMTSLMLSKDKHNEEITILKRANNDLESKKNELLDKVKYLESMLETKPIIKVKSESVKTEFSYEVLKEKAKSSHLSVILKKLPIGDIPNGEEPQAKRPKITSAKKRSVTKVNTKRPLRSVTMAPALCNICGYSNPRRNLVTTHIKLCKLKAPEFKCNLCESLFFTQTGFKLHAKSKHGLVGSEFKSHLSNSRKATLEVQVGTSRQTYSLTSHHQKAITGGNAIVPQFNQTSQQDLMAIQSTIASQTQLSTLLTGVMGHQRNLSGEQTRRPVALSVHSLPSTIGIRQELSVTMASIIGANMLQLMIPLRTLDHKEINFLRVFTSLQGQLMTGPERRDYSVVDVLNGTSFLPITCSTSESVQGDNTLTITEVNDEYKQKN